MVNVSNHQSIINLINKDKSTISFLYSKKERYGVFFSELFIYHKVKNLGDKEVELRLKCAKNSSCKIFVNSNSVRLSFKDNYLGRFKLINNDDMIYFKANFGRKIIEVNLHSEKMKKTFKDEIINQPDLYAQLHEEKLNFMNQEPMRSLFTQVKAARLV